MVSNTLTNLLTLLEPIVCLVALALILRARQIREYRYVAGYLGTRLVADALLLAVLHPASLNLTVKVAYSYYFWIYWPSHAIEALFALGIIISIYRLAMEPLKGLQSLGMIMFRWAGAISIAIAVTIGFGPHVTGMSFLMRVVIQMQQTQSVLTLCMLLFVCFAIHPMGLSYRSRVFGVSLGLGLMATVDLVQAAWVPHVPMMLSIFSTISSVTGCVALALWTTYFAVPEPKRRMIVLPTTSPFFRWNQISEVLGDEPGFVAIGAVTSDMFAPAEIEVMRRASGKMDSAVSF